MAGHSCRPFPVASKSRRLPKSSVTDRSWRELFHWREQVGIPREAPMAVGLLAQKRKRISGAMGAAAVGRGDLQIEMVPDVSPTVEYPQFDDLARGLDLRMGDRLE